MWWSRSRSELSFIVQSLRRSWALLSRASGGAELYCPEPQAQLSFIVQSQRRSWTLMSRATGGAELYGPEPQAELSFMVQSLRRSWTLLSRATGGGELLVNFDIPNFNFLRAFNESFEAPGKYNVKFVFFQLEPISKHLLRNTAKIVTKNTVKYLITTLKIC